MSYCHGLFFNIFLFPAGGFVFWSKDYKISVIKSSLWCLHSRFGISFCKMIRTAWLEIW